MADPLARWTFVMVRLSDDRDRRTQLVVMCAAPQLFHYAVFKEQSVFYCHCFYCEHIVVYIYINNCLILTIASPKLEVFGILGSCNWPKLLFLICSLLYVKLIVWLSSLLPRYSVHVTTQIVL